jgi:peptidoglycan/xylan/chitin deacetylase (PgdA/CDA1 family)
MALTSVLAIQIGLSNSARAEDPIPSDSLPTSTTIESTTTTSTTTTTVLPNVLRPKDIVKISKIRTNKSVVFITIDDGATVSPELARILDKKRIPITTFAMPEMLWRARNWYKARKDMTFENHTNTHAHMTLISQRKQKTELCWTNKLIKGMFGKSPIMYRPPRGSWIEENRIAMAKCGLKYAVLWSVVIENIVPKNLVFQKGDIILLHYVQSLPTVLPQILEKLKKQKLQPALLRDYLG